MSRLFRIFLGLSQDFCIIFGEMFDVALSIRGHVVEAMQQIGGKVEIRRVLSHCVPQRTQLLQTLSGLI